MDVRDILAREIEEGCFKQAALACKAGLTEQKLSDIVNKRRKLDANEMFELCKAMRISPDYLFAKMNGREAYDSRQVAAVAS